MMNVLLTQDNGAILGPIAKVLGYILNGIYSFFDMFGIHNTGLCIIIFTFIVNALMIPITLKQQKFSKLNSVMAPEIQAIQAKYRDKKDPESARLMQIEQQSVYQKYGVSPTAGCLPMLITLPIFFALYRVIYNIPAYVPQIKELYENVINSVVSSGMSFNDFAHSLGAFVKDGGVTDITITSGQITAQSLTKIDNIVEAISALSNGAPTAASSNYIVDILSQFNKANWEEFWNMGVFANFPSVTETMKTTYSELKGVYSFLGMNIMERASLGNPVTLIIPILAVVTQYINTKVITSNTNQDKDKPKDPTQSSMETMNKIMPLMSGVFCFMFPLGVGLYWVAGNVVRTIQGVFINMYFNKVGLDKIAEKNIEKRNKKLAKKGIDPNSTRMQQVAQTKTSSIRSNAATNTSVKASTGKASSKKDFYINHNIKNGGIADFANMLNRDYNSSGEANDSEEE